MTQRPAAVAAAVIWALAGIVSPALAQTGQAGPAATLAMNEARIKHRFTFMGSGGLDLDVFGEVVTLGLSCDAEDADSPNACNRQFSLIEVRNPQHYPDVYRTVQKRWQASLGFGIFQKDELIVQVTGSRASAAPGISIGRFLSAGGDRPLRATFNSYRDQTIEGGLRHYLRPASRSKSYVNLLFGRRTVDAITATLEAGGTDGGFGEVRFYDKATVNTAAVVFGITYERGPVGIFVEAGFRWTAKLRQQDADLEGLGVPMINDTRARIFMPASAGLLWRF